MNKPLSKVAQANADALSSLGLHPNPDYGKGCLRRKVLLRKKTDLARTAAEGQQIVIAELEDNCHQFRVRLFHDGDKVCAVNGDALRFPNDTCPGSVDLLKRLVGVALGDGPGAFAKSSNPREFCTHLFDLACLAYTHASRPLSSFAGETRLYHAIIQDEDDDGIQDAKVLINDKRVIHWHLKNHVVQDEGIAKGANVHSGFTRWATTHLQGDELEAGILLAKTNFVAMSRRVDTEKVAGTQLVKGIMPKDICYTYRSPVMENAHHLHNSTVDYSDNPDGMLKFVEIL
jgi:hypothetical protein